MTEDKENQGMASFLGEQSEDVDPAEKAREALLKEFRGKLANVEREKEVLSRVGCWDEKNEKTLKYYRDMISKLEKDQEGKEDDGETSGHQDDIGGGD